MTGRTCALVLVVWLAGCTANDDVPAPQLSAVSPASARAGSVVTITGAYLCQQPDTGNEDPLSCANMGSVQFGTSPATPTLWSDTTISVEVPSLAPATLDLSALVAGRSSNAISFTIE